MYCSVILLDKPLEALTYRVCEGVGLGSIVQAPIRNTSWTGIVVDISAAAPEYRGRIRPLIEVIESAPIMAPAMIKMLTFMADYYGVSLGLCLKLAMPGGLMRAGRCHYGAGTEHCDEAAGVLAVIEENGGTATGDVLTKRCRVSAVQLQHWVEQNVLTANWILEKARRQESTETTYAPTGEGKGRLGSKQQKILDFVLAQPPPVRQSTIYAALGGCGPILERLVTLGYLSASTVTRDKTSFDDIVPCHREVTLTDEQTTAVSAITQAKGYTGFLLHGVTGSGKTEVYLEAMAAVRAQGLGCILMLPEIALTPQFCAIFRGRFGDDVAVLHSGLSEIERYDTWNRLRTGRLNIAIGARSALFAPVQNLGLIVVDEEHDGSFKQDETPRYHARDMALVLGQKSECPVILGSATPSMESFTRANEGRLRLLTLTRRPLARCMPDIEIVDMRGQPLPTLPDDLTQDERTLSEVRHRFLSPRLEGALRDTLARREQAIVFLNRRGYATFLQCRYCGYAFYCPNCDVSLTYHRYVNTLQCHYCDYSQTPETLCPKCQRPDVDFSGLGTERMVEVLKHALPDARIDRLDKDRAWVKGIRAVLDDFKQGNIDILVGTQMVAKGHDIHNVTLVGIISADMSLNLPDFRAAERTFQLLTQVSGRAGRGDRPGTVIIQAMRPSHHVLQHVLERDFHAFAQEELNLRQTLQYPPFVAMAMVRFEGTNPIDVERCAHYIANTARRSQPPNGTVLGPAPAPIAMLCGKARYQLFLKHPSRAAMHQWLQNLKASTQNTLKTHAQIQVIFEIDPINML